jgi:hypothetical protein
MVGNGTELGSGVYYEEHEIVRSGRRVMGRREWLSGGLVYFSGSNLGIAP